MSINLTPDQINEVRCATCKSEPGNACVTPSGAFSKAAHTERERTAIKAAVAAQADAETFEIDLTNQPPTEDELPRDESDTHEDAPVEDDEDEGEIDEKAQATIDAVKEHAVKFYHQNGWDIVVETMADEDILEVIGNSRAKTSAVNKMRKYAKAMNANREEIQSA